MKLLIAAFTASTLLAQFPSRTTIGGGGGGGGGTVAPGTIGQLAYYAATGSAVSGGTMVVEDIALTGASFPVMRAFGVAAATSVDMYTAPTGKKVFVYGGGCSNPVGGTNTTGRFLLHSGSSFPLVSGSFSLNAGTNSGFTLAPIVLDAGEAFTIRNDIAGAINCSANGVQFDSSVGLRSVKVIGLSTGNNTIYTVPVGKNARILGAAISFNVGSLITLGPTTTGTGDTSLCLIPSGGGSLVCTSGSANLINFTASVASAARTQFQNAGLNMAAGDSLVMNVAVGAADDIVYFNVIEF